MHENIEDHGAVGLLIDAKDVEAAVLQCQKDTDLEGGEVTPHGVIDAQHRAADGRAAHERLGGRVRCRR